jgi:hypothetical protein
MNCRILHLRTLVALAAALVVTACGMVDPNRPVAQPDTNVFGNLLEVSPNPDRPGVITVEVQVGPPRELTRREHEEKRPTPAIEGRITAEVSVTPDSVVLVRGRSGLLDQLSPGSEVAVVPIPGTTRMIGASRVLLDAAQIMDFETFHRWQLPTLGKATEQAPADDPARINSSGVEHVPVPVSGGRVLYFSAHLRRAWDPKMPSFGARRPGLSESPKDGVGRELSYRTKLGKSGWSTPERVQFPGLDTAREARVTWMNEDETVCLVTVREGDGPPRVGRSERKSPRGPWGAVKELEKLGKGETRGGVYLAGSTTKIAFARPAAPKAALDLFLFDPGKRADAMPLDPRINTPSTEWSPRVGPSNQLLFCRGDRQLIYSKGIVDALRLPGPFRRVLTEANPTRDGKWMFLCQPHYTPIELDQDIFVAPWKPDGSLGEPVAVDDWRP